MSNICQTLNRIIILSDEEMLLDVKIVWKHPNFSFQRLMCH